MEASLRVLALLLLAGCGSAAPTVDLPTEWDAMEGAVGVGIVENAEPAELHVRYDSAPTDLLDSWKRAVEGAGWKISEPKGLPGLMSFDLTRGEEHLELIVSSRGSRADVLLTK